MQIDYWWFQAMVNLWWIWCKTSKIIAIQFQFESWSDIVLHVEWTTTVSWRVLKKHGVICSSLRVVYWYLPSPHCDAAGLWALMQQALKFQTDHYKKISWLALGLPMLWHCLPELLDLQLGSLSLAGDECKNDFKTKRTKTEHIYWTYLVEWSWHPSKKIYLNLRA